VVLGRFPEMVAPLLARRIAGDKLPYREALAGRDTPSRPRRPLRFPQRGRSPPWSDAPGRRHRHALFLEAPVDSSSDRACTHRPGPTTSGSRLIASRVAAQGAAHRPADAEPEHRADRAGSLIAVSPSRRVGMVLARVRVYMRQLRHRTAIRVSCRRMAVMEIPRLQTTLVSQL
jgi:hypothetical protein